jgi:hypothetical protein
MKRKMVKSALAVVALASAYLASSVYPCQRIQAQCSYRVTFQYCYYSGCGSCGNQLPCCYDESGPCLNDPYSQGFSEICFGICGGQGGQ